MTGSSLISLSQPVTDSSSSVFSSPISGSKRASSHELNSFSEWYAKERRSNGSGGSAYSISHDELTSPVDSRSVSEAQSRPVDAQDRKTDDAGSVRNREPVDEGGGKSEKNEGAVSERGDGVAGSESLSDENGEMTTRDGEGEASMQESVVSDQSKVSKSESGPGGKKSTVQNGSSGESQGRPVGVGTSGGGDQATGGSGEQRSMFTQQSSTAEPVSGRGNVSMSNGSVFLASMGTRGSEGMTSATLKGATGGTAEAAPSDSTSNGPTKGFSPQVIRGMMSVYRTGGGAVTMRLEPESLGSLRVQMTMTQGRVSIQFHTSTTEARALLTQSMDTLRSTLEQSGLKLEQVTIQPLSKQSGPNMNGQQQNMDRDSSGMEDQSQDAAGDRSRGYQQQSTDEQEKTAGFGQSLDDEGKRKFDEVLDQSEDDEEGLHGQT